MRAAIENKSLYTNGVYGAEHSCFNFVFSVSLIVLLLIFKMLSADSEEFASSSTRHEEWFNEVFLGNTFTSTVFNDKEYTFIHNNGQEIDGSLLINIIGSKMTITLEDGQNPFHLFGVGIYKTGDKTYTDFFFSDIAEEDVNSIREQAFIQAQTTLSKSVEMELHPSFETMAEYSDSYSWSFYDGKVLAGRVTSNVSYEKKGTVVQNGKTLSVWDVKYFNHLEPKNGYQSRQLITRSSVASYSKETLRSYGPTTTAENSQYQVSLTGYVPTVSWTGTTLDSKVTDTSSLANKYARWKLDIALGTTTSENSFTFEPGARFTNSAGNFGIQHSHSVIFYKNLISEKRGNTGVLTCFLPDR